MKAIGKTNYQSEIDKVRTLKQLKPSGIAFFIAALLPILIILLFNFKVLKSTGLLDPNLEASVAKIIANDKAGTAFLISPTKLLTARHVVQGMSVGDEVQLIFDKAENKPQFKAKVLYYPTEFPISFENGKVTLDYFMNDFAVLDISEVKNINPLTLGDSDIVNNLDEVILIGYPLGDYSITEGNINSDKYQGYDLFKLDATSNPGNSGGPLILKSDKSVIGILVGGGDRSLQGENVALKINSVLKILQGKGINIF